MAAWRQPTLWFVLLGAAWFAVEWAARDTGVAVEAIVVDPALTEALAAGFETRAGRAPTPPEADALLRDHLDQEILYREAIARHLDAGDPIVRRRLIQKMRFLLEDAPLTAPDDAALQAWLSAHADRFARPAQVSFEHVFFRRERAPETLAAALVALRAGEPAADRGDAFVHGTTLRGRTRDQLSGLMGGAFADAVLAQPTGDWQGPLASSYGNHLVKVTEQAPGRLPALSAVRAQVEADWRRAQRALGVARAVDDLRGRYRVEHARGAREGRSP